MKRHYKNVSRILAIGSFLTLTSFTQPSNLIVLNNQTILTIQDDGEVLRKMWDDALGTFQFQIINSRISPKVDISIIRTIENNRHDTEVVYIPYAENIKIKILPKSLISGEFQKLELFAYVAE